MSGNLGELPALIRFSVSRCESAYVKLIDLVLFIFYYSKSAPATVKSYLIFQIDLRNHKLINPN